MKLSTMRKKARSRFNMGPGRGRIKYRDDQGVIYDAEPGPFVVPIAVIRGRAFTKPQAAKQHNMRTRIAVA